MAKLIKVTIENRAAIEAALAAANGRSNQHTFTSFIEIRTIAEEAEKSLLLLLESKSALPGACVVSRSGGAMSNAYKYSRITTKVLLARKTTGWYLETVSITEAYSERGFRRLVLTPAQDQRAIEKLRACYWVDGPEAPIVATTPTLGDAYRNPVFALAASMTAQ